MMIVMITRRSKTHKEHKMKTNANHKEKTILILWTHNEEKLSGKPSYNRKDVGKHRKKEAKIDFYRQLVM